MVILFIISYIQKQKPFTRLWLNSLVCIGCLAVTSGTPIAMLAWGGLAMLGACISHFFTYRSNRLRIFPLLALFSISGIPYSIGAYALAGLASSFSYIWLILALPIYALLIYLFIDSLSVMPDSNPVPEPLNLAVYAIGLVIMAFSPFAILIKDAQLAGNVQNYWWAGVSVILICLLLVLFNEKINLRFKSNEKLSHGLAFVDRSLTFQWLERIWQWFSWFLSGIINFLTGLLEGEGGIIWALVMLVLLVSLVSVGRS